MNELRTLPGPESTLDLAQLLMSPDLRVVKLATRRIGLTRDTRYVKDLVRWMARADKTIEEENDIVGEGFDSLKLIGEAAFDPLVEMLEDTEERIHCKAIECLGVIGCARSVGPLCAALNNPQVNVKVAALASLRWLGIVTEDVEKHVVSCLHDSRREVQLEAVATCGELGLKSAVPILITRLDPNVSSVKDIIIPALGKIGDRRAVKPLVELLDTVISRDPTHPVITIATDALGKIGDPQGIRPLIITLKKIIDAYCSESDLETGPSCGWNDQNGTCRGSCRSEDSNSDSADRFDEFDSVKEHLVKSLIQSGEPVVEPLVKILCQVIRESTIRPFQPRRQKRSLRYRATMDEIFVDESIVILKHLGSSVIEPTLVLLHDENARIREVGSRILAKHLNDSRVTDALVSAIITETEDNIRLSEMISLASFHPCTYERLIEAISHRHQPFTLNEQTAIGPIAMFAVKDLILRLGDPEEEIRSQSLVALTQFVNTAARLCPDDIPPQKKRYRHPRDKGTDVPFFT